MSAGELFKLADQKARIGDADTAITIYRALEQDPDAAIHSEARFRHALLLTSQKRLAEAAVLYRAILDEQPHAQRVRLELAALLSQMGDLAGALRLLRQAQAGGLPQEVARVVDQYAAALRSQKPINASVEIALAPNTNVNRATNATTLDTVLAPFQLSDDARAKSGLGLKIGGQVVARLPVGTRLSWIARASGQGSLYRDPSFNDVIGSVQTGVEARYGKLRLQPLIGESLRWYGGSLYASTSSASVNILKPIGHRAQIEADLGAGWADYRRNNLQDGLLYNGSITYERALSDRFGGSATLSFNRQDARDPGYATTSVGGQFMVWRDMGKTSVYASGSLFRLHGDERLFLFRNKRREWLFRGTIGGVFRAFTVSHFAPLIRLTYERNRSTVGIYDYKRLGAELGISRAF
jgi:tetratricopeptide (TPR) repeat protein